jgi:hypothetical protein
MQGIMRYVIKVDIIRIMCFEGCSISGKQPVYSHDSSECGLALGYGQQSTKVAKFKQWREAREFGPLQPRAFKYF